MQTGFATELARRTATQRNVLAGTTAILLAIVAILSVAVLRKEQTTVLVPTMPADTMTVHTGRVDRAYLEMVTRDVLKLLLEVSPATTEYAKAALRRLVAPDSYGEIHQQMSEILDDVYKRKFSTDFNIHKLDCDAAGLTCTATGGFAVYFGKEQTSYRERQWTVTFKNVAGRLWLWNIVEDTKR